MSAWRVVGAGVAAAALVASCTSAEPDCNCAVAPRGCVYTGSASCPCSAMVCSDVGPIVDRGDPVADAPADRATPDVAPDRVEVDAGRIDAGTIDAGTIDAGTIDAGTIDAGTLDVGAADVPTDRGFAEEDAAAPDVPEDHGRPVDVAVDAPVDAPRPDAGVRDVPADSSEAERCDLTAVSLNRSCVMDSQCRVGIFVMNCCGTSRAIAVNTSAESSFRAFRDVCERVYGGIRACGCATLPTELDDGTSTLDEGRIVPGCVSGMCVSRLRP